MSDDRKKQQVKLNGVVIEHLKLGNREWFSVQLENNQVITIDKKLCEEIIPAG